MSALSSSKLWIILGVSLIVYIITILLSKTNELIDKVYIYITSAIYLIVINYIINNIKINPFGNIKYLLYSCIATIVYIIIVYILNIVISNNKKYDDSIKRKNDFIKKVNLLIQDKDLDEIKEINEMIRFSDPVSIDEVKDIEDSIINEIKEINDENIKEKVKNIKKLITKRNTIIKDKK